MRTHTTSTAIGATYEDVFAFVADGEKLPVWAIGFAKAIERAGNDWYVTLASGDRVALRIEVDATFGIVDFFLRPASESKAVACTRVLPHAGGSVYTFTMLQAPDMPDEAFDAQVAELERELTVLRAHLESSCPL